MLPLLGSLSNSAATTPLTVFRCPSDAGSFGNKTPVFERKGTSYQVEGVDLKKEPTDPQRNRLALPRWTPELYTDIKKELLKLTKEILPPNL